MFTINVSYSALKALSLTAAVQDVRGYLCGVCVDTTTEGRVHLVSTDGHRMLIVGNATCEGERVAGRFIVPTEGFKNVKPAYKKDPVQILVMPEGECGGTYEVRGKVTVSGRLLDGHFPEWTRVISRVTDARTPGPLAHFNFGYLGDFATIAELLECKVPRVIPNGDASAHVFLGAHAFGVLMPMRIGDKEATPAVEWLEPITEPVAPVRIAA